MQQLNLNYTWRIYTVVEEQSGKQAVDGTESAPTEVGRCRRQQRIEALEQEVAARTRELAERNRSLAVATALERVRLQALKMQQSADILALCDLLYRELQQLGFPLRTAEIDLVDDEAGTTELWGIRPGTGARIRFKLPTNLLRETPPLSKAHGAWKNGASHYGHVWNTAEYESVMRRHFAAANIGDPEQMGVSFGDGIVSHLFFFSYGHLVLWVTESLSAADLEVGKRFADTFAFAYTRFLELKLKEQQNRELTIQVALERVRAQALGMEQSAEILELCDLLVEELQGLGYPLRTVDIAIVEAEAKSFEMWSIRPSAGYRGKITIAGETAFGGSPHRKARAAQASGAAHYSHVFSRAEHEEYIRLYLEVANLDLVEDVGASFGDGIIAHYIFFSHGFFVLWMTEEISAAELDEAKRFVDTFAFAYTRFLELEQAEGRTRQALIEVGLERIRAEVTGMQQSADIVTVLSVMWAELKALGLDFATIAIAIQDEERDFYTSYNVWDEAMFEPIKQRLGSLPHNIYPIGHGLAVATNKSMLSDSKEVTPGLKYQTLQTTWSEQDVAQLFDLVEKAFGFRPKPEEYKVRFWSKAVFEFGALSLGKEDTTPLSDGDMALLQRVADVFSSGYARYLDFQRLERDSAVERVRTQVFSMQEANDLDQVVLALSRELQGLDIQFRNCGLQIVGDGDTDGDNIFLARGSEVVERLQTGPWQAHTSVYEAWDQQEVVYRADLAKDNPYGEEGLLEDGLRSIVDVPFRYGTLALNSGNPNAFWPPDMEVLQAFAAAIEGAYARHLDFQQLEQQRQQARRESAVDRVRAEAMSMRQSDDINKVAAVLYKEIISLCIETLDSAIIFIDEAAQKLYTYYTFSNLRIIAEPDLPLPTDLVEVDDETMVFYFESRFGETREFSLAPEGVDVVEGWKAAEVWTNSNLFEESRLRAFYTHMGFGNMPFAPLLERFSIPALPYELVATCVPFEYGFVRIRSKVFRQQDADIVAELTQALSLGYLRYLGFRQLEEEVAERQRAEAAMRRAKEEAEAANRAKSQFLANMSHEIRTPMNAILGYAQLLQRDSELSADQQEAIATIEKSGDHLLRLINDVLDLSKIEAGRLELTPADFDLHQLLHSLATMFALRCQQKQLGWKLQGVGDGPVLVYGDEAKLSQILINLLGNALKFTQSGEVALHFVPLGDHRYCLEVADTGPGIDPAEQERLFAAFEQGIAGHDQGGSGLGLSITSSLLELMGTSLELDSAAGKGARFSFTLTLPPAQDELGQIRQAEWSQVRYLKAGQRVRALVVDDVRENRQVLSRLLASIGVEVELAESGQAALQAVQEQRPDIVFMDMRMPDMDGMETARQLWQQWGQEASKIVAISASVLDHERRSYLEAGFNAFVDKPFRAERIFATMAQLLGVEYDYAEPTPSPPKTALELQGLVLPTALLERLQEAAELTSVTELEGLLDDVAELGEALQPLAAHLRQLSQDFDMDGVIAVLERVVAE